MIAIFLYFPCIIIGTLPQVLQAEHAIFELVSNVAVDPMHRWIDVSTKMLVAVKRVFVERLERLAVERLAGERLAVERLAVDPASSMKLPGGVLERLAVERIVDRERRVDESEKRLDVREKEVEVRERACKARERELKLHDDGWASNWSS